MGEGTSFPRSPSDPPQLARCSRDGSEEQSGGGMRPSAPMETKAAGIPTPPRLCSSMECGVHRALPPAGPRAATSWAPRGLGRLERDVTHFFHPLSLFKRRCSHCLLLFERASPPHRHQVKADGISGCFSEHVSEGGARCGSGPPSLCPSALPASSSPACDHCQACPSPVSNANLQLCSSESSAERPLLLVSCRAVLEPPRVWPLSCC